MPMVRTRSRDGTLPLRTYEAVTSGFRMRGRDGQIIKLPRGRPRKDGTAPRSHRDPHASFNHIEYFVEPPQLLCRLKTPNYRDELAQILGNDEKPYYGLFENDAEASDTDRTRPTAEDRSLCHQLGRSSSSDPSLRSTTPVPLFSDYSMASNSTAEARKLTIHFGGKYTMDAWYRSAYPAEYTCRDYLAVCCYCLDYTMSDLSAERHALKCTRRVPPGREIYRSGKLSMWEVDGLYSSLYCQNLCLLTKTFLSSKSLYREVQPFYFYVLTLSDEQGAQFVGYFSKQKMYSLFKPEQPVQSVSCIMSLPFNQAQGYGQFLIEFSYLLVKQQQATGSPETPLSSLGEKAFRAFWKRKLCSTIRAWQDENTSFSIGKLSRETGIHVNHVVLALEDLGWLDAENSKAGPPRLNINVSQMNEIIDRWEAKNPVKVDPKLLMWSPLYE